MSEFEPRRTEPGTEFGYTGNDEREIGIDDDIPEGWTVTGSVPDETSDDPEAPVKLAHKIITRIGVQKTMKADDEGVVWPKDAEEVRILDTFGLPVARKAAAEKKAEAPKATEPDKAKE